MACLGHLYRVEVKYAYQGCNAQSGRRPSETRKKLSIGPKKTLEWVIEGEMPSDSFPSADVESGNVDLYPFGEALE